MTRLGLALVVAIALPRAAFADDPPASDPPVDPVGSAPTSAPAPAPDPMPAPPVVRPVQPRKEPGRDIVIDVPGERSRNNKLLCGGLLATGVIAGALGVYWHLDSRDASNAVSADYFTGEAWTQAHVDLVERADRSKTRATVAYTVGGAFLIGAIAAWIFTEPKTETAVIHTGVTVGPTSEGGTVVSRMWSF
jgi:hypothetical protein